MGKTTLSKISLILTALSFIGMLVLLILNLLCADLSLVVPFAFALILLGIFGSTTLYLDIENI